MTVVTQNSELKDVQENTKKQKNAKCWFKAAFSKLDRLVQYKNYRNVCNESCTYLMLLIKVWVT